MAWGSYCKPGVPLVGRGPYYDVINSNVLGKTLYYVINY